MLLGKRARTGIRCGKVLEGFSDVMVVVPGGERPKGTQKELWRARQMGIKVIWVENKKWT